MLQSNLTHLEHLRMLACLTIHKAYAIAGFAEKHLA